MMRFAPNRWRSLLGGGLLALLSVSTPLGVGAQETQPAETQPAAGQAADDKDVPQKIDMTTLDLTKKAAAFVVPVPSEMVQLLEKTKYGAKLGAAIGAPADVKYEGMPQWKAALSLGISMADLLIAIETMAPDQVLTRLDGILAGMKAVGAPQEQIDKVTELRGAIASGAMEKEKLVGQFDLMRVELVTTGREKLGDQNFALIAVGGWARAANLAVSVAGEDPEAMKEMEVLKVRSVIDALLSWLGEAQEVQPVVESLKKIVPITSKERPEPPTAEELQVLRSATEEILKLAQAS